MPDYNYKAIRETGETYKGVVFAKDEQDLAKKVRSQGGVVVDFEQQGKSIMFLLRKMSLISTVKAEDKIMFAKNLGAMIGAGLSISKALSTLEKQFKNRKFKNAIIDINEEIKKGNAINESLKKYPNIFSPLFIAMVRAGEESGRISDSLHIVSKQMENSNKLAKKVRGALIYPAIITFVMISVGVLMLVFIVPGLQETFADLNTELPMSTRIIIGASDFIRGNPLLFVLMGIIAIVGIVLGFKTERGRKLIDTLVLKIPFVSTIAVEVNSARTARTLSSLLSSGVDVLSSFDITKDVLQNSHYKKIMDQAKINIQKGDPLAELFTKNEKLYPPVVSAMIEVGEETGKLPDMLSSLADFYEEEVDQKTKNLSTIIEPILMVFIGAAVGFFAVSMITPMYSIMGNI
ncbi:TPA: hypothetical protein DCZ46_00840 [Candidatus Campbellbacteria bacterium]|nr:MAG: pilus assembly protein PilC, type IV pilus assembly protein PilC [Candidatus Campbellbacteria bacterium GW2011_OD1_34_28]KKP75368.1 MAG: Competence protein PilC [Candidatus Campbellbacteria bacterium GW2011_GWD2_35_24]KKP76071.1 MAG: pilus assembly protein PilC, type IV pilus assembly protein PilC [Candidatus Campbellbacteria bacterium GW2011_GWC2_35_28]KKP77260.1 MAG: Competence protein PilC [Candidatus Campbellbacteria bacterium GW2011_GWC1_35_31]KKP79189.1 MAG: Competence protein Pil